MKKKIKSREIIFSSFHFVQISIAKQCMCKHEENATTSMLIAGWQWEETITEFTYYICFTKKTKTRKYIFLNAYETHIGLQKKTPIVCHSCIFVCFRFFLSLSGCLSQLLRVDFPRIECFSLRGDNKMGDKMQWRHLTKCFLFFIFFFCLYSFHFFIFQNKMSKSCYVSQ